MSKNTADVKLKRVSSAADNMSALVDDLVKKARKSFKSTGKTELDAKFLKESVGALRELYGLLEDCEGYGGGGESVKILIEKEVGEWGG